MLALCWISFLLSAQACPFSSPFLACLSDPAIGSRLTGSLHLINFPSPFQISPDSMPFLLYLCPWLSKVVYRMGDGSLGKVLDT